MTGTTATRIIGIDGTRLTLDGRPFPFTGLSFFNAIYNPAFNRSPAERLRWLRVFRDNGVNALRVWCQWDFTPPRVFIDVAPEHSLYTDQGEIRDEHLRSLMALITAADSLGMVIEVTLFSHEKRPNLPPDVLERGARNVAARLIPYRNVLLQIWNEDSTEWARLFRAVKEADPARLVTSSPGVANVLGDDEHNTTMDLLTPHTIRRSAEESFWEVAPRQIASLIERFRKPVIDDEPARNGPVQFGGIEGGTQPQWHVAAIKGVRAVGGYPIYHHDMFQYGYSAATTPPSGIPEPDFSPFHRHVFDYLRDTRPAT
ncbi:MAG: hypothetical protein M3442_13610 [Chloroflexota bacterium]|nr:hypothetical protein [Chloroflexota bacterium]